jgi:RsiW-degrading membrane proteinase PrsW (M82 family)
MGLLLSFVLGIVPMLILAWVVYWLDRYEKEPWFLLGGVFIWGAVIAAGSAFLINTLIGSGIYLFTKSQSTTYLATGSLIAPVVEEALKGMAVLAVFLLAHNEFDSILDGVVYAGIVALGFAASENVFYFYEYGFKESGLVGLFGLFMIRVLLVGWQHPFYTAFFGIGLAIARLNRNNTIRLLAPLIGFALAVLMHSTHNTLGSLIHNQAGILVGAFFDWSGWTMMFLFILWATGREKDWIVNQLRDETVLGTITLDQYRIACSAWGQSLARLQGLMKGRFLQTTHFYQLCAELAYKKQQLTFLGEEGGNSQIIENLRQELRDLSTSAL